MVLQEATEGCLIDSFQASTICAIHAGRDAALPEDIILVRRILGEDGRRYLDDDEVVDRMLQTTRDSENVTKPAIRRLARRGGVKRISGLICEESRKRISFEIPTAMLNKTNARLSRPRMLTMH